VSALREDPELRALLAKLQAELGGGQNALAEELARADRVFERDALRPLIIALAVGAKLESTGGTIDEARELCSRVVGLGFEAARETRTTAAKK